MSSIKDGDEQIPNQTACDAPAGRGLSTPSAKSERPPSPKNCRNFIRRQTADAMPKIVKIFVERAKDGSVPHFTSLAKVGGFDKQSRQAETPKRSKRRSLARQLLDEVERYEAQQAAEQAAAKVAASTGNLSPEESS